MAQIVFQKAKPGEIDLAFMKTKYLIGIITAVYLFAFLHFGFWKGAQFGGDSWGYYVHLPSTFLYQDVGDYTECSEAWRVYNPRANDPQSYLYTSSIEKRVVKYPVGVAIMETPFFFVAHVFCLITGVATDGFSWPYMFFVGISSLFYAIWGIWLLLLALKPYFNNETTRLWTGLTIGLATNLFYFSTYTVGMSHPYLFFLYALMLLGIVRFYEQPSTKRAIWVGASAGMISLTRSPEVICVLIPLLWGLNKWADFPKRGKFILDNYGKIGLAMLAFLLMLVPQALYWKFVSGHWWFNGYQGEQFDWKNPHILDGIFHYRNGWLIYTPVMAFSLLGIFWLRKYATDARLAILCFLPLHWYIIYSWWCWNYINGFGSRPMVEVSALLAFPLAAFLEVVWQKKWSRILGAVLLAFFIWLNLFQTWQFSKGLLLTENTNPAYYKAIFGKSKPDDASAIAYSSNETQPELLRSGWKKWLHDDQDSLVRVAILATNDMEDSTGVLFTRELKKSGAFSFRCDEEYSPGCFLELPDTIPVEAGDYLRISISCYVKAKELTHKHEKLALLIVHIFDAQNNLILFKQLAASNRIYNESGSFKFTGKPDVWGEASYFVRVPQKLKPSDRIKTYLWNPSRQAIYVDDMAVELWRYQ